MIVTCKAFRYDDTRYKLPFNDAYNFGDLLSEYNHAYRLKHLIRFIMWKLTRLIEINELMNMVKEDFQFEKSSKCLDYSKILL